MIVDDTSTHRVSVFLVITGTNYQGEMSHYHQGQPSDPTWDLKYFAFAVNTDNRCGTILTKGVGPYR